MPGVRTYLTGYPAINHDTQSIFSDDLARGESLAIPIALLVMVFMFGTLGGIVVPVLFAAMTIPTTLGFVWIFAHTMDMAIYVTNIVALIGLPSRSTTPCSSSSASARSSRGPTTPTRR